MKEHKTACVVLMMLIAGFIFGTQKMGGLVVEAESSASAAEGESNAATLQRRVFETNLIGLTESSRQLRGRAKEWLPHFARYLSPQDAEQDVGELIRQQGIFLLSQRYEQTSLSGGKFIPKVMRCELLVEDDYASTLSWLGMLEEKIPVGRVTECRLERGDRGNDVNLRLTFDVPLIGAGKPKG